jgi:hypothetical protein
VLEAEAADLADGFGVTEDWVVNFFTELLAVALTLFLMDDLDLGGDLRWEVGVFAMVVVCDNNLETETHEIRSRSRHFHFDC